MLQRLVLALMMLGLCVRSADAERRRDLNKYVLAAVDQLAREFAALGYDSAYFTHDLPYGDDHVPASARKPKTMCVAAVTEVLVTALELYSQETHDDSVFTAMPTRTWAKATRRDIRPYIFMFRDTVDSNGTGDALQQFGIGEELTFPELQPGDFVNFNRMNKSGHAVVFLAYIDRHGDDVPTYDRTKVAGFRYFSAQGKGKPDGGLGYRWAYFEGTCPAKDPARPRDCHVVFSKKRKYLDTGYLLDPSLWTTREAIASLETRLRVSILGRILHRPATALDFRFISPQTRLALEQRLQAFLSTELPDTVPMDKFDGTTTD